MNKSWLLGKLKALWDKVIVRIVVYAFIGLAFLIFFLLVAWLFLLVASSFVDNSSYFYGFKDGIDPAWRISVFFGGIFALLLAFQRTRTATKQTEISLLSHQAERYEKASERLWHPAEASLREAGCYAFISLGQEDLGMAIQCRNQLVSFICHSSLTPKQKEEELKREERRIEEHIKKELENEELENEELENENRIAEERKRKKRLREKRLREVQKNLSRYDILAADHALSSLYQKWCNSEEFSSFELNKLPPWFWGQIIGIGGLISTRSYPRANLDMANLGIAEFCNANLSCANLTWAFLNRANLNRANLKKAKLFGANLSGAHLRNADLSYANLIWTDLSRANLGRVNLRSADLHGAKLWKADLEGADFNNANLSGANFIGDTPEGQMATNLTVEQIESAIWNRKLNRPKVPPGNLDNAVDNMKKPYSLRVFLAYLRQFY